jgi:WD40 repeat protein
LPNTDILVSADLTGFIHFWCVSSTFHPKKGQRIVSIRDQSESEVGKQAYFPIRAIGYDPETCIMWTGDEMGYVNKWDLSNLIEKVEAMRPTEEIDEADMAFKQKIAA